MLDSGPVSRRSDRNLEIEARFPMCANWAQEVMDLAGDSTLGVQGGAKGKSFYGLLRLEVVSIRERNGSATLLPYPRITRKRSHGWPK